MATKKRRPNFRMRQLFIVLLAAVLVGIMVLNVLLMYDIATEQIEEIGRMRVQNIAIGFEKSLNRAEYTLERIASSLDELIQSGAEETEIRQFLSEQKNIESILSEGVCLNVYCVVDGVVMISDMETPADYVLQDRPWYRGLLATRRGDIYISSTYEDAFTDDMCFTVAVILDDGSTAACLDYSVSEIQSYVNEMGSDEYGDAMIVDANETIVGYTDPNMTGKKLSSELPQYRNAFLHAVTLDEDTASFQTSVQGENSTIFCSKTDNGWYLMCSVNNLTLYRENYGQLFRNLCFVLLLALVIVLVYLRGLRGRHRTEQGLHDQENIHAESKKEKKQIDLTIRSQRKYQIGITSIFVVTMIIAITGSTTMSANESRIKMEEELWEYNYEVGDWVLEQKSILDMFNHVVAAKPELLLDYEEMVKFLDDITKHYPKISATYIANPDFPHGHPMVMNNGWVPDEDYVEEERIWYTGALTAEDFNITEPYYDARTGEYCITFSKVVSSDSGEFYGVFAIDFYLDVLMDILGGSYSDQGYAFLVDKYGLIIDHPNSDYELSGDDSMSIHELPYDRLYSDTGMVVLKDYDGKYKVCASMVEDVSGFRIIVVKDWWSIYGNVTQYAVLFLGLFGGCILAVNVVINRMIQWQSRANDSLKEAAETAIRAEQAKTRFLSNMSHEIRTPINAVLGMNEMILRECKDEQIIPYAENIHSSGKTLLFLINDILDLSKIESGKMEIVPAEYEVEDSIIDLWNVIYFRAQEKNLTVDFVLDETMPRTLYGDEVRVKQIVTNLLTNAVKYTSQGGVEMHAAYRRTGGDMMDIIISVKDTGMGIRQEDMGKLFESFRRLDEKKNRNIEGTGLGMSITMSLLELMGGDMNVESEYGKGSTFTVTIPQKIISDEPIGDFESIMNRRRPESSHKHESFEAPDVNLLVVDDNDMNLTVFKALLKRTKMNIITADSGRKCLELVKKEPFHMIFMDHMMPEMDGIETLHEMRKLTDFPNENTPVIALTANALFGAKEFYMQEGFTNFLTKPIDADLLEKMIVSYLPKELVQLNKTGDDPDAKLEEGEGQKSDAGQSAGQDSISRNEPDKEKFIRLKETGFHTESGLQYSQGDSVLYEEMLLKFAKDSEGKITDIETAFQEEDIKNYQILVHALKSTSKMLGADMLSDAARNAEEAAKNQDVNYISENHEGLIGKYREAAKNISDALCLAEKISAEDASTAGTEVSKDELLECLSGLRESLNTFEVNTAESLLKKMSGFTYLGRPASEILYGIIQDVDDFELSAAAEKTAAVINSIECNEIEKLEENF